MGLVQVKESLIFLVVKKCDFYNNLSGRQSVRCCLKSRLKWDYLHLEEKSGVGGGGSSESASRAFRQQERQEKRGIEKERRGVGGGVGRMVTVWQRSSSRIIQGDHDGLNSHPSLKKKESLSWPKTFWLFNSGKTKNKKKKEEVWIISDLFLYFINYNQDTQLLLFFLFFTGVSVVSSEVFYFR